MLTKIAHRLLTLLPIVLGSTFLTIIVGHLAPSDPMAVYMGFRKDPLEHARLAHAFGLDLPIWQQYLRYLGHLVDGNLRTSYFQQDQSVSSILGRGIPISLELGRAALGFSLLIGIPCGILAAVHHRSWIDTGTVAGMFVLLLATVALVGPLAWTASPDTVPIADIGSGNAPFSGAHPLGTDPLGHDTLARLLSGLRVSFEVVILVKAINVTLGVALGLLSGYCRGWVNGVLGRVCDILMTFPGIQLAILLVGTYFSVITMFIAIGYKG